MGKSAEVSPQLHLPTYQNRLRVIGRQLDLSGYRSINLVEIAAGFLVRVMRPGERTPDALEFPHTEFPELIDAAIAARGEGPRLGKNHPLLSTGYEDALRALGYRLDTQHAEAIVISEMDSFLAVSGVAPVETYHESVMSPFQSILGPDAISALLDEAFHRRTASRTPALARIFKR